MEYQVTKPKKPKGGQETVIIIAVVGLSVVLAGGFYLRNTPGPPPQPYVATAAAGSCCDTTDCTPISDAAHTLTYNGDKYGLLKSTVTLREAGYHLKDSGQKFNGDPIILNTTDGFSKTSNECGKGVNDQIWNVNGKNPCYPIPNEEILYVCRANCTAGANICRQIKGKNVSCYGDTTTVFDIYFRLRDIPNPGIPQPIKDCIGAGTTGVVVIDPVNPTIISSPYIPHHSEQLHSFELITPTPFPAGSTPWISPYCKPAIYLYPSAKETIRVAIAPKGKLNATIPSYPENGWVVSANPDGNVEYNNKIYPYLYYEAAIPDTLLAKPDANGYVVEYKKLSDLFSRMLPKLGLNKKEENAFTDYWLKALPESPYYRVSVVPQALLDRISPLTIEPHPQTMIRVTLNFQPLDSRISVMPPTFSDISRKGFTVVEWGGLFKQDKKHPFTCLE